MLGGELGNGKPDGGMPVMAAGMHQSWGGGGKAQAARPMHFAEIFVERERVDVETHRDDRSLATP